MENTTYPEGFWKEMGDAGLGHLAQSNVAPETMRGILEFRANWGNNPKLNLIPEGLDPEVTQEIMRRLSERFKTAADILDRYRDALSTVEEK